MTTCRPGRLARRLRNSLLTDPEHVGADDDLVLGGDPGERLLDLVRDVVMTVDERREDRHALAGAEDELEALKQALGEVRVAGDDEMLHSCAS